MKISYNPVLKQRARELRKQGLLSEALLWNHLKSRKICGYQFMRQKPIGEYIVDFYCTTPFIPPLLRGTEGVVIEIDGESHRDRFDYDMGRQQFLESLGLKVLRFNDIDVKRDMDNVLIAIEGWIANMGKTTPYPPLLRGNKK